MTEQRPITTIYDASTGIQETRPMTDEEWDLYKIDMEIARTQKEQREQAAEALATLKASAKAKLVAGEPLTAEEADTLVI